LREVFVEGSIDKFFYKTFLLANGVRQPLIYEIQSVEVPPELVLSLGFEDNNRDRVITLAYLLESQMPHLKQSTEIADTDFRRLVADVPNLSSLLLTDYSCLEMYCMDEICLDKILGAHAPGFTRSAAEVIAEAKSAFSKAFAIREAHQRLGLGLRRLSTVEFLRVTDEALLFDDEAYIGRYLSMNDRAGEIEAFRRTVRADLGDHCDWRHVAHKDDVMEMLAFYFRARGGVSPELRDASRLHRLVLCSAEIRSLNAEQTLSRLLERVLS